MPKATIDEDGEPSVHKHDVRANGEDASVKPITKTGVPKDASEKALRIGVNRTNATHVFGAAKTDAVAHLTTGAEAQ